MGLRCVVGTAAEPSKPFRLRVRSGHECWPGRIDGRLRLGRRSACVPDLRWCSSSSSDDDVAATARPLRHNNCCCCCCYASFVITGRTLGRWLAESWSAPWRSPMRWLCGRLTGAWARRIGVTPVPAWPVAAVPDCGSNRKSGRPVVPRTRVR